jgi:hypothetical protein
MYEHVILLVQPRAFDIWGYGDDDCANDDDNDGDDVDDAWCMMLMQIMISDGGDCGNKYNLAIWLLTLLF